KVTDFFFAIVNQYLERHVSVVVEAAFQHKVWRPRMPAIRALASPWIVLCSADDAVTSKRPIQRGLANPDREFYHGDHRVVHYKKTGEILVPADYEAPQFDVPTIQVATDDGYVPSIDAIIEQIKLSET
ncbi:MAG TPA: hypothetical protein VL325_05575, partial [Pyrinomonadaceae bacterium]|nr:hypothetical protein [Pyrinomonadaceae bacterium]